MNFDHDEIRHAKSILGVKNHEDINEIKKSYRCLAKRFHPDVSPLSKDYKNFIALQEAYNTLIVNIQSKGLGGGFYEFYPKNENKGFQILNFEKVSARGKKIIKTHFSN